MQNLLVLTDFSDAASHAASYACILARQFNCRHMVLLHAFHLVIPGTDVPVIPVSGPDPYKEAMDQLQDLERRIRSLVPGTVLIKLIARDVYLEESINAICRQEHIDLIIMGATGKSGLERTLMGSTAISISEVSHFPILIVPVHTPLLPVDHIVFACDLLKVKETTPLTLFRYMLNTASIQLDILNIDDRKDDNDPEERPAELSDLHQLFDAYHPQYHFEHNPDISAGIMQFLKKNEVSMLVTVPRQYGWFKMLFHHSISNELIDQAKVPVLSLHQ